MHRLECELKWLMIRNQGETEPHHDRFVSWRVWCRQWWPWWWHLDLWWRRSRGCTLFGNKMGKLKDFVIPRQYIHEDYFHCTALQGLTAFFGHFDRWSVNSIQSNMNNLHTKFGTALFLKISCLQGIRTITSQYLKGPWPQYHIIIDSCKCFSVWRLQ